MDAGHEAAQHSSQEPVSQRSSSLRRCPVDVHRRITNVRSLSRFCERQVKRLRDVMQICCGWGHSMARSAEGVLFTSVWFLFRVSANPIAMCITCCRWGWNADGQLGLGDVTDRVSPQPVTVLKENVVSIGAGRFDQTSYILLVWFIGSMDLCRIRCLHTRW